MIFGDYRHRLRRSFLHLLYSIHPHRAVNPITSIIIPPAKKQKTSEESSAPTQAQEPETATPHKNDEQRKRREVSFSRPEPTADTYHSHSRSQFLSMSTCVCNARTSTIRPRIAPSTMTLKERKTCTRSTSMTLTKRSRAESFLSLLKTTQPGSGRFFGRGTRCLAITADVRSNVTRTISRCIFTMTSMGGDFKSLRKTWYVGKLGCA
jgi:hypothetical protein